MDLYLLIGVAVGLLVVLITILFLNKKEKKEKGTHKKKYKIIFLTHFPTNHHTEPVVRPRAEPVRLEAGVPLRAQIARNQRTRARAAEAAAAAAAQQRPPSDESDDGDGDDAGRVRPNFADEKMGTKKRAKLEAKADKKLQREAELAHREDKKKREEIADEERRKADEKERQEELKREEAERMARELKEKQEYEEYLAMKAAFSIEEEGYDEQEDAESQNLLADFINYIKTNKVVLLEELARAFKLKTQAAIDRIQELKADGTLTGVLDDRGKFIYISEEELAAVAKFIRQRGRISITELAESSNNLINLTPIMTTDA